MLRVILLNFQSWRVVSSSKTKPCYTWKEFSFANNRRAWWRWSWSSQGCTAINILSFPNIYIYTHNLTISLRFPGLCQCTNSQTGKITFKVIHGENRRIIAEWMLNMGKYRCWTLHGSFSLDFLFPLLEIKVAYKSKSIRKLALHSNSKCLKND